ncbi:MAG: TRAP transporter substrate-binding protein [Balneolales bacterium]
MNWILKNFIPKLTLVLFLFFILEACSKSDSDDDSKTIILAHAMHLTHPVSVAMYRMADLVETYSDGQLKITIYPTQQLGTERELLELAQIGTIGMTKISAGTLENIVPAMRVFSLPYLFRDSEHANMVFEGQVGKDMLLEGVNYGLRGLTYYDAGSRSLYTTNRPINAPSDLSGLKIRVMESVIAMNLISSMGGSPTPLSYGELYTAFQGGIVDGAENNPPSFYSSRHYEVVDYYILNEHTTIPDVLVISNKIWEGLNEEEQSWLQKAIDESAEYQQVLWRESVEESMSVVKEAGVTIIHPDKNLFRKQLRPMLDQFRADNPELYKWVDQIHQVE